MLSLPSQCKKISKKCPSKYFVLRTKCSPSNIWFVLIRLSSQSKKNKTNSSDSCKFIWNTALNSIHPLKIPFRHNMSWCRIRIGWNIIIWVSQRFWIKYNKKCLKSSSSQSSHLIFRIKIRIKIHLICLSLNSKRICRTILVLCSQMNLAQSCLQEWKLIMKTIKPILCWIVNSKTSPKPTYNTCSNYRKCTCQTCNNCSSPKTYLTPRLNITNKSCLNYKLLNNNSNKPNKFTRASITCIIQGSKLVQIHYNKKKTSSISMQITQNPTIWNISHQMLNTFKCLIYMSCIMHCQKNTCSHLLSQTLTCLNTIIIVSIQIRWSWVSNLMVLQNRKTWLIPKTSTLFSMRSSYRKSSITSFLRSTLSHFYFVFFS